MTEQNAENQAENVITAEAKIKSIVETDVPVLIPRVGEQLKAAREKARLDVLDVAQSLKLGPRQVEALENGDWERLPGQTFIRGFVRNYARLVNIDPLPLMRQLDSVLDKPVSTLAVHESAPANVSYSSNSARGDRNVVLLGLLAVLVAGLAYFLMPNDLFALREEAQSLVDSLSRKNEPAPAPVAPAATAEPVFPPGTTPQQIMNPQSIVADPASAPAGNVGPAATESEKPAVSPSTAVSNAVLHFDILRESWIEVRDRDNKVIFSQRLLAGSQKEVPGGEGPLSIHVGYAPGVKLQWRGQVVDLVPHTRSDVARLVLE